jgi:iron(III) transport system substrate-binding protein
VKIAQRIGALCAAFLFLAPAVGSARDGADSAQLEAARREGKVVIYSVLSTKAAQPLIADFQSLYPGIEVAYDGDKGSNEMDARYRAESAAQVETADVVWSSSTDMQIKLVVDGFAAEYRSPEAGRLPEWAVWRSRAFGTTLEPVVFAFNTRLISEAEMPKDHAELALYLSRNSERLRGKVTGFDISKSGVGLMFALRDRDLSPGYDRLLESFGVACFKPLGGTGEMLTAISKGEFAIGYNMMGAYAISRAAKDLPNLGVVFPRDYTLLLSRVAFVSKYARHPNAGRLWLDYLLSKRGQTILGNAIELYPIRGDVEARFTAFALRRELGSSASPIRLDSRLSEPLEPKRRQDFIENWQSTIGAARPSACR